MDHAKEYELDEDWAYRGGELNGNVEYELSTDEWNESDTLYQGRLWNTEDWWVESIGLDQFEDFVANGTLMYNRTIDKYTYNPDETISGGGTFRVVRALPRVVHANANEYEDVRTKWGFIQSLPKCDTYGAI